MLQVKYHGQSLLMGPRNFFKLSCGVAPSFGFFRAALSSVNYFLDTQAGASGDLVFTSGEGTFTLSNIYIVKSVSLSALNSQVCDIVLADERIVWQYYLGNKDYNTYVSDRDVHRDVGAERDYELGNLNAGSEWTFPEIFADLFSQLGVANYTINFSPSYQLPRNILSKNIPIPVTLQRLLNDAHCFLAVDPFYSPPKYTIYSVGYAEQAEDLTLLNTYASLMHKRSVTRLNPLTSASDVAKMQVAAAPDGDTKHDVAGQATGIGGTGTLLLPSAFAYCYEGGVKKNTDYLTDIGSDATAYYKNSFANVWRDNVYGDILPFALNRAIHEITWCVRKEGAFTAIKSYRPREPTEQKDTFFHYDDHWLDVGSRMKVFIVQSAATGDGVYNCKQAVFDGSDWADTSGADRINEFSATNVEVFNLYESDPLSAYKEALAVGDIIQAWKWVDDDDDSRWVGIPLVANPVRRARTTQSAPAQTYITANLYNRAGIEITSGLGSGITVYCLIAGGGNLNAAIPRLPNDFDVFVQNIQGKWWCPSIFQASEVCDCYVA